MVAQELVVLPVRFLPTDLGFHAHAGDAVGRAPFLHEIAFVPDDEVTFDPEAADEVIQVLVFLPGGMAAVALELVVQVLRPGEFPLGRRVQPHGVYAVQVLDVHRREKVAQPDLFDHAAGKQFLDVRVRHGPEVLEGLSIQARELEWPEGAVPVMDAPLHEQVERRVHHQQAEHAKELANLFLGAVPEPLPKLLDEGRWNQS